MRCAAVLNVADMQDGPGEVDPSSALRRTACRLLVGAGIGAGILLGLGAVAAPAQASEAGELAEQISVAVDTVGDGLPAEPDDADAASADPAGVAPASAESEPVGSAPAAPVPTAVDAAPGATDDGAPVPTAAIPVADVPAAPAEDDGTSSTEDRSSTEATPEVAAPVTTTVAAVLPVNGASTMVVSTVSPATATSATATSVAVSLLGSSPVQPPAATDPAPTDVALPDPAPAAATPGPGLFTVVSSTAGWPAVSCACGASFDDAGSSQVSTTGTTTTDAAVPHLVPPLAPDPQVPPSPQPSAPAPVPSSASFSPGTGHDDGGGGGPVGYLATNETPGALASGRPAAATGPAVPVAGRHSGAPAPD